MSREIRKKIDGAKPAPLLHNPFAALGELEALRNLPPAPVAKPAENSSAALLPAGKVSASARGPEKKRGRLILRREKKDRGGKVVVVIGGFPEVPGANAVMIGDLAKELKGKLGCGGTFDRQEIVLQGDRCAAVAALLGQLGFTVGGVVS